MSTSRPKRERRPPQRYEPEEVPIDDFDDDEEIPTGEEEEIVYKRYKGEFDDLDDEEEEDNDEPNEYDVNDGFIAPDDYESSVDYEDDDQEDEQSADYDDDEEEDLDDDEEEDLDDDDVEYDNEDDQDTIEEDVIVEAGRV